ncbi:hypothetical protein B0T17DRAFT_514654 [Bombardia bombarda]|uniref:FAD-binding PCMH-type domain-containing protein n=1 Tax=Bombardia bombarda TaxID=252184 RepID=A0AA39XKS4_9PEZI|nr:hypothetical protein B0T17DRAFT_514654 [Bombardia bombarda]
MWWSKSKVSSISSPLPCLCLLWLIVPACEAQQQDLGALLTAKCNSWNTKTTLSFPGDGSFANVTERWTVFAPPMYSAAISPATEEDVVKTVKLAAKYNISFLATGAGHGYGTTLGKLQNGLDIDLSQFKSISVNQSAGTVTVGGGVRMRDVIDAVFKAGFEIQTGSCSCPGFVGATIGAGVGRWSGIFGLIIDALVSVRLVTADGRIVQVSKTSNPDLFWAIRGAGANFGIITSATYRLHKIVAGANGGGQVMNADILVPANMSAAYFNALQSFSGKMPANLAAVSIVRYDADAGAAGILANWDYMGSEADGRRAMAPILALNPPVVSISTVPWNKLFATAGFGIDPVLCENNVIRDLYSANVRNLSASTMQAAFNKMGTFYSDHPEARGSVLELETFPNQAATSVPDGETAYPWRDALGNMIFLFSWDASTNSATSTAATKLGRQLRDDFVKTSGYPDLSVYVSYAHGDEKIEQIYGRNKLPRLAALKKSWDPRNVFAYNNALPTKYP